MKMILFGLTGRIFIENSIFKNKLSFTSDYPIFNSSNLKNLEGSFKRLTLNNTKTKSIHVLSEQKREQRLIFLENSKVIGDIIFYGETGKVIIDSKSNISGKIVNGDIEKI